MLRPLALALLCAGPAAAQDLADTLTGRWRGIGVQGDGLTWQIEVAFTPDGALVWYPDLTCAARWLFELPASDVVGGVEQLTAGDCDDGLDLLLSPADKGAVAVDWMTPDGAVVAGVTLSRQQP